MINPSWLIYLKNIFSKTENIIAIAIVSILLYFLWLTNPSRMRSPGRRKIIYIIIEIITGVIFAVILGMFRVYKTPQGSFISLEMLPIFYIALRSGGWIGLLTGLTFGFTRLLLNPYIVHPIQVALDYPLAFAFLGLAGFFRTLPLTGIIFGGIGRLAMHVIAAAIFLSTYAPKGTNPWLYFVTYNGSHIIPEIAISIIIMFLLGLGRKTRSIMGIR